MKISLNIIFDLLSQYRTENYVDADAVQGFTKCLPLSENTLRPDLDCLYFSGLSSLLALRASGKIGEIYCVCWRDRIKDAGETAEMLNGLIIVNENINPTELLTRLQARFFALFEWVHNMTQVIVRGGGMQELVDIAEPVLENFIGITDASFIRLAHTRHIDCDCPICADLVRLGCHSEATMKLFRDNDLFSFWEKQSGIFTDYSCKVAKYPAHHKIFKFNNAYFVHVVMTCNRRPLTPCLKDLFQLFIDVLAAYVEREWNARGSSIHIYDAFLTDLLQGGVQAKSQIRERAQYVGIAYKGRFCLLRIAPPDSVNVSIGKMLTEFAELFPKIKFVQYRQELVALYQYGSEEEENQFRDFCGRLDGYLVKHNALCGVSLEFETIDELPHAFNQAALAIKYGESMRGGELVRSLLNIPKQKTRIYFFSRYIEFCLLGEGADNVGFWRHTKYYAVLKALSEYDRTHKSSLFYMLYVYLITERSATDTSAALNMHRNNVIYHINRVQDMFGLDLSRHEVRQLLLLSYSMLQLHGFGEGDITLQLK